jgi:dTDP-L-rhamnose 4-epimerase
MGRTILITGGAGFVGSHLADELLAHGYSVRALDSLSPQVHGPAQGRPSYLADDVELIVGDVRDPQAVARALEGVDAVFHLAAMVGVGQSMYAVVDYMSVNNMGTAVLLEALARRPVERLVVASSMSLYGEGLYCNARGKLVSNASRSRAALQARQWEPQDSDGEPLMPIPTPELKRPALASVYALSKYDQECMCLTLGAAYGIPAVALRFFNIYGPRQALSNPYTGVLAIFASRLLNGQPPLIHEDGYQRRDFVSVYDVAQACRLALEAPGAAGQVFNVGSGQSYTVRQIAADLAAVLGMGHIRPEITQTYRVGDIRHCFADITQARELLGYRPAVTLERGLEELAGWLADQSAEDRVREVGAQLAARGLIL